MAEKSDDLNSRPSSTAAESAYPSSVEPVKNSMLTTVEQPDSQPLLTPVPPQPQVEEQPPVKDKFDYWSRLPYPVEEEAKRLADLDELIADLYVAVKAGDFAGGARTASRQIKRWLHLKFKMPKETRIKLIKFYYELSLTPGIDIRAADSFAGMVKTLAQPRKVTSEDITLDWRPLYDDLYRHFIAPNLDPPVVDTHGSTKDLDALTRLARSAQRYFPASEVPAILEKVLPEFDAYFVTGAFNAIGLIALLLPLKFSTEENPPSEAILQNYFPLLFSLWAQISNSTHWSFLYIDLFGRIASCHISAPNVKFGPYGVFTRDQMSVIFTNLFRIFGVPIGPIGASSYSRDVSTPENCTIVRYRGPRSGDEFSVAAAKLIIYSLTEEVMHDEQGSGEMTSVWAMVESLLQGVESAFHPSNSGAWTHKLASFVYRLAEKFANRWTEEQRGKRPDIPEERRLTPAIKRRFVLSLRKVVFMCIYDKNAQISNISRNTLALLAHLEPDLIIPGALKRFYPSMQGLLEAHRTTASLNCLSLLMRSIARHKVYRSHVMSLLGLALPGIDSNDLSKTQLTLTFITTTCMLVPLHNLSDEGDEGNLARNWLTSQMEILESMPGNDFPEDLLEADDAELDAIARSSTGTLAEWVISFFDQIFVFLGNMPEHKHSKTTEEAMVPIIALTVSTVLQSLEPKLFTLALNKMQRFVSENMYFHASEAAANIVRAFVEIRPEESLAAFFDPIVANIRTEIFENGAGISGRITTTEVVPGDRALLWNWRLFSALMGPRTGRALLPYLSRPDSPAIQVFEWSVTICRGTIYHYVGKPLINALSSLTNIYTVPGPLVKKEKADLSDWAPTIDPETLQVNWHVPSDEETHVAIRLYFSATEWQKARIANLLINDNSSVQVSDDLRQSLKYIVSALLGAIPLYARCPLPEEWVVSSGDIPPASPALQSPEATIESVTEEDYGTDEDSPDVEDDAAEDDDDDYDDEATTGRNHKYPDGLGERPLKPEQTNLLIRSYLSIGSGLLAVANHLWAKRHDNVQLFMELSNAIFGYLYPRGLADLNDVRMELTNSAWYTLRRSAFVIKILPKGSYPTPLLVQKMEMLHRARVLHNQKAKGKRTWWQDRLISQLVLISISPYVDARRAGQGSLYATVRRFKNWAPLVLPPLLDALKSSDIDQVKGAQHTLRLSTAIEHTLIRNWDYTDKYILAIIEAWQRFDKISVQNSCSSALSSLNKYKRHTQWLDQVDESIYEPIRPEIEIDENLVMRIKTRRQAKKELEASKIKILMDAMLKLAKESSWRLAHSVINFMCLVLLDKSQLVPIELFKVLMEKMNDDHPQLRSTAQARFATYLRYFSNLGLARSHEELMSDEPHFPNEVVVRPFEHENFTQKYIEASNSPPTKDSVFHDFIKTGMFVWPEEFFGYKIPEKPLNLYFKTEVLEQAKTLAPMFNREWVHKQLGYLGDETTHRSTSSIRTPDAHGWGLLFRTFYGLEGAITEDEIREEIVELLGAGETKYRHQATYEVLFGLVMSLKFAPDDHVQRTWQWLLPFLLNIYETMLNPDNVAYWRSFLSTTMGLRDPRQIWPLAQKLLEFRLDSSSHEFFQESSRAHMLRTVVQQYGWRYSRANDTFRDYMEFIIHPYQDVRREVSVILSTVTALNRNTSFNSVKDVLRASMEAPSTGFLGWVADDGFEENMKHMTSELEEWRKQRLPAKESPETSKYIAGAGTILGWWQSITAGSACMLILPFIPKYILPQTLHVMMDVKEDVELMSSATVMLKYLSNAPYSADLVPGMVDAIGSFAAPSNPWHHRLRIMVVIQVFYYRQLFVLSKHDRKRLFDAVIQLLNDAQLEVREAASSTLSGMVQCSKFDEKNIVLPLLERFKRGVIENPMPKRRPRGALSASGISTPQAMGINPSPPRSGATTPDIDLLRLNQDTQTLIRRHAAVLGLSSIITAFPYEMPEWMPSTLAFLANRASGDRGMIGMSVKKTLGDFKKTHQDTWSMDQKLFNEDELEALEGVFSSNYFA